MKKIKILTFLFVCLFVINAKADVDPPSIVSHKVMVTNKNGTQCYENGEKTDVIIPYGTTLLVYHEISGSYIDVYSSDSGKSQYYNCKVKYSDVSSITQTFDMNNEGVNKITSIRGIILASGGVNLRKGPSVTYAKLMTVPQYTTLLFTYSAGTYWYYTDYNNLEGWVTAMNSYIGFEGEKELISPKDVKIYDSNNKKVLGTIPANTAITNYLKLVSYIDEPSYYVIYNGIKGYVNEELYININETGKIKLNRDYEIVDEKGKPVKKLLSGRELEYSMIKNYDSGNIGFYIPEFKMMIELDKSHFEYLKKSRSVIKEHGYLGEGLFGEKIEERPIPSNDYEEEIPEEVVEENKMSSRDMIIIGLLGGILLAIIILVIIKATAKKKRNN